jgi:hypothetical protein
VNVFYSYSSELFFRFGSRQNEIMFLTLQLFLPLLFVEVSYGERPFKVGRWEILAEIVDASHDGHDRASLLGKKAVPSMDKLMGGVIEYYLEAPHNTNPNEERSQPANLIFDEFTKATRPSAWKNTDLKLQSTLPILAVDKRLEKIAGSDDPPKSLVKVTLQLGT